MANETMKKDETPTESEDSKIARNEGVASTDLLDELLEKTKPIAWCQMHSKPTLYKDLNALTKTHIRIAGILEKHYI